MMLSALSNLNRKNIIRFLFAFIWGLILFLPLFSPPPVAASSGMAIATNALLAAELAGSVRQNLKTFPTASNNIVTFKRRNKITGQVTHNSTFQI